MIHCFRVCVMMHYIPDLMIDLQKNFFINSTARITYSFHCGDILKLTLSHVKK